MRQKFHLIFHIQRLTWRNKFFLNDSLTVEERDQHNFLCFLTFEIEIFVSWRVLRHSSLCRFV